MLGGATRGPLPFKKWLLNREHKLKLKEEENIKKRAEEEALYQKAVDEGTSVKEGFEKFYYGIGMAALGHIGGNAPVSIMQSTSGKKSEKKVQLKGRYK